MGRTKGSKNFNRRLLQDVLDEKGIDLIDDYYRILKTASLEIQARMLMHLIEFLYPKRRPEDSSGSAEDQAPGYVVTEEFLLNAITGAKGDK